MRAIQETERAQLARFKELVLRTCGFHLENERETALRAAIRERMSSLGLKSIESYFAAIQADIAEFGHFVERLTVNETYFMREPDHLKLIAQHLVPEIVAAREGPIRILCAGCSSGEEPYSIAILLRECYGEACESKFSISGVDIDAGAIAAARRGIYGRNSFRGMDPERMVRHFDVSSPGKYRLRESVRRLVAFEKVNLLAEAYPPLMHHQDIILYRNVSIYFPKAVQRDVFHRMADLLREPGYLLVGATETMHHDLGILPMVKRDGVYLFQRQPIVVPKTDRRNPRRPAVRAPSVAGLSRPPVAVTKASQGLKSAVPVPRHSPSREVRHLFEEALEQARAARWSEALGSLDELLGQDSSCLKAQILKASVLMSDARYEEARRICDQVLARDALCLDACLMLGVIARREADDIVAHQRFREALYLDAACWLAHYYIAEILILKGDVKRARAGYESALRILGNHTILKKGRSLFPLSFNAGQFIAICRHKLSLLKENA